MDIEARLVRVDSRWQRWVQRATRLMALPFSERRALLLVGDVLLVNGAVLAALRLWAWIGTFEFTIALVRTCWLWFVSLSLGWAVLAWLSDLYDVPVAARRPGVLGRVVAIVLILVAVYLLVYFVSPRNALPRLFFLFFAGITLVGVSLWRWTYATVFTLPFLRRRTLIVGAGWAGRVLAETLSGQKLTDCQIVGFVDDDLAKRKARIADHLVLGGSADLVALVQAHRIDEIVIAITHEVSGDLFRALMDCQGMGVRLVRMPDLYEQLTRRVPVEHIDQEWVLDALSRFSTLSHVERISRRLLDLACGLIGLAFLGLFLPLVALAIYLDDRGMVFYAQVRSGAAGKPFSVIKFRTMHCDAESDGQPQWAQEDDERATRVGRVLRKTRLDELPQVINVLRGEMSVVGPRPERPEFIAELEKQVPHYRARLVVKPGLTGWAQIHYGYGNSVKDALTKLQYDLYYIRRQSLWLDLYIVFRTIGVIFKFQGT